MAETILDSPVQDDNEAVGSVDSAARIDYFGKECFAAVTAPLAHLLAQ